MHNKHIHKREKVVKLEGGRHKHLHTCIFIYIMCIFIYNTHIIMWNFYQMESQVFLADQFKQSSIYLIIMTVHKQKITSQKSILFFF